MLVLIGSLNQLAININLPAIPDISRDLHISLDTAKLTISVFLAGFACSLLLCGPLADHFGRRPVLFVGLGVYTVAGVLASVATSGTPLLVWRAIQGVGAGSGLVVSRAASRDRFDGPELLRANALMNTGLGVITGAGPVVGGVIDQFLGWRIVYLCTVAFGVIVAVIAWAGLPEPTRAGHRPPLRWRGLVEPYGPVLRSRHFLSYSTTSAFSLATWWTFLAGSAAIFISELGQSPVEFGLYPPLVIAAYMVGGVVAARCKDRPNDALIRAALSVLLVAAITMTGLAVWAPSVGGILGPMVLIAGGVGVIFPAAAAAVLSRFPSQAATAAAANSFMTLGLASLITSLVGLVGSRPSVNVAVVIGVMVAAAWAAFATAPAPPSGPVVAGLH